MSRPKAKLHQVQVTASRDGEGIKFEAGSEIWDDSARALHFHKDHHGLSKDDFHLIEFVLDDQTGGGLRFPPVPHDAMWITLIATGAKAACPDRKTGSDFRVVDPICVSDDGQRLIVRNENPRREQWAFTLNFVKRAADGAIADDYVS